MPLLPAAEVLPALKNTFAPYLASLPTYTPEQFTYKHDAETWSLGQLYEHVCQASEYLFLANTKRCLEQRKGQLGGEMNEYGLNVFKYNSLPPMKFKMPTNLAAAPIEPQPLPTYQARIEAILAAAEALQPLVDADAGQYKTQHPIFSWLSAAEWFQSLEVHTRHHLRQKAELEGYVAA